MITSALYHGDVMHHRFAPKTHRFVYTLTSWLINIDELALLDKQLWGFGYNRAALFSFHDKDYGWADGQPVRRFIDQLLADHQQPRAARVMLLCQVRGLGCLFNPLAVWFCYDPDDQLMAVVYEVRNTFGQRHHYLVPVSEQGALHRHIADKRFYVSPFMPMACEYAFRFQEPGDRLMFCINQRHDNTRMMSAVWRGQKQPLQPFSLCKQLFRSPVSSLKIITAIHWEAFRLWRKGLRLIPRPSLPATPTTLGREVIQTKETHHESY